MWGAKPPIKPMRNCCDVDAREQTVAIFLSNTMILIHENAFGNVVSKTVVILFRT